MVYHRQDSINLGEGALSDDRQDAYDNQGTTVVNLGTDATLDVGASQTWLTRTQLGLPMLGLFEDSAGGSTEVYIGGQFGTGTRGVNRFAVNLAGGAFQIVAEDSDAGTRISTINVVNSGTGAHRLRIQGDSMRIGSLGSTIGFFGTEPGTARPTITGAKGGNAALTSLLSALAAMGLITDSTT
jgi:hypothetical protein